MQINFQYSPAILQRAHTLHYRKFFLFQSRLPMLMGILAIWAGLLLFVILGSDGNRFLSLSLVLSGILAIGIYFWLMKTTGTRVYKRLKDYHEPFLMEINNDNIEMTIGGSTTPAISVHTQTMSGAIIHVERPVMLSPFVNRLARMSPTKLVTNAMPPPRAGTVIRMLPMR